MTYFEEKGFGFLRPDGGGKDIFFHISRLHQGQATDLVPGTKVPTSWAWTGTARLPPAAFVLTAAGRTGQLKVDGFSQRVPAAEIILGAHRLAVLRPAFDPLM